MKGPTDLGWLAGDAGGGAEEDVDGASLVGPVVGGPNCQV